MDVNFSTLGFALRGPCLPGLNSHSELDCNWCQKTTASTNSTKHIECDWDTLALIEMLYLRLLHIALEKRERPFLLLRIFICYMKGRFFWGGTFMTWLLLPQIWRQMAEDIEIIGNKQYCSPSWKIEVYQTSSCNSWQNLVRFSALLLWISIFFLSQDPFLLLRIM